MYLFPRFAKISIPVLFMQEGDYLALTGQLDYKLYEGDTLIHQESKNVSQVSSDRFEYQHTFTFSEGEVRYLTLLVELSGFVEEIQIAIHRSTQLVRSPDDVRRVLGANKKELEDQEIALPLVYCNLLSQFGTGFLAALVADTKLKGKFSELCVVLASLDLVDSFMLRVAKSEKNDNSSYTRLANSSDYGKLKDKLLENKNALLADFTEWYTEPTESFNPSGLFTSVSMARRSLGE